MVTELALILVATALVNNVVLVQFLGLCPFMGVSTRLDSAVGLGIATTFVLTLTASLSHLVETWFLVPLGVEYLRTLSFIVMIAAVVQFTEIVMRRRSPLLHRVLGLYLPLITSNCAVLGIALLTTRRSGHLADAALYGFGSAVGFTLVLIIFSMLRIRIDQADVPAPFKGSSVALMTAGIVSLAFMGFKGIA